MSAQSKFLRGQVLVYGALYAIAVEDGNRALIEGSSHFDHLHGERSTLKETERGASMKFDEHSAISW